MPKMKTKRSAAKRFRRTGSGKLTHSAQGRRHMLAHKSPKRKRHLREKPLVHASNRRQVDRLLAGN